MAGTIIKGDNFFHTTLYEGNGIGQRVGRFVPFTDSVTIGKSLIFNRNSDGHNDRASGDAPYLSRTVSSAGDRRKFTLSFWFKHGVISSPTLAGSGYQIGNPLIGFGPSSGIATWQMQVTSNPGSNQDLGIGIQAVDGSGSNIMTTTFGGFAMGDTTKWYHVVAAVDTTQSSNDDKNKIYIDGQDLDIITTPTYSNYNGGTNYELTPNSSGSHVYIGNHLSQYYFDGYFAEVNFVDGTVYDASKFGQTDTSTGRWIPKTITGVTYGTNGFRLEFANTAGQTLGDDTSGNGNDFTVNNITVTPDLSIDTPSTNYANFLDTHEGTTKREGNLKITIGNSNFGHNCSSLRPESGKWYAEFRCITKGRSEVGIQHTEFMPENSATARLTAPTDGSLAGLMWYANDGKLLKDSSNNNDLTLNTYDANDIIGIALDLDTEGNQPNVSFYKNGTIENNGTNIPLPHGKYCMVAGDGATGYGGKWVANFGQNPSFSGGITAAANTDGSGSLFKYTPPTGYKGLKQDNMPAGKDLSDMVWIKNRDATDSHQVYTSNQGPFLASEFDQQDACEANDAGLSKFLKGGFEISSDIEHNTEGESFVGWNWVCNGGTTAANTQGSGANVACTIQKNATAGFSIVQFSLPSSGDCKVEHGLGKAPEWIIARHATANSDKNVFHKDAYASGGANSYLKLNNSNANATDAKMWGAGMTSSVAGFTADGIGSASTAMIAYIWTSVLGYSKFGSYTGNGNADGAFIFTGFKPSWIMFKEIGNSNNWPIYDNQRFPLNPTNNSLFADLNQADNGSSIDLDVLSNGFKCRTTNSQINRSGGSYIYMAFAEHPFNGDGSTAFATAR